MTQHATSDQPEQPATCSRLSGPLSRNAKINDKVGATTSAPGMNSLRYGIGLVNQPQA
jgi:hypothetical protein